MKEEKDHSIEQSKQLKKQRQIKEKTYLRNKHGQKITEENKQQSYRMGK